MAKQTYYPVFNIFKTGQLAKLVMWSKFKTNKQWRMDNANFLEQLKK